MINLCQNCDKSGKCYYEKQGLVCKKIWDYQKEQDKKERETAKITAKAFWDY